MFEDCKVELLETFGDDLTVVNAARVSLGKHTDEFTEKDGKLIKYLALHEHTSPFFHTIGFARNEVSRRYVDDDPTFHIPEFRTRAPGKKQGSNDDVHPQNKAIYDLMAEHCRDAFATYSVLLNNDVPPEQARMVLPQNMMTEFIETGSIAAYARLCHLRLGPDAQKEIRTVAGLVAEQLKIKFPVSWAALIPTPAESSSSA